jgi:hypothetical protein
VFSNFSPTPGMVKMDEEVSYLLVKEGQVADLKVNIYFK